MAAKKPIVISSTGEYQQLQTGDYLNVPIAGFSEISQTNDEVGAIVIGTPVYNDVNDGVKKAKADASGTSQVIGLVGDTSISAAASGGIAISGVLPATTGQWDAVFGTTGGLTKGTIYWLSAATAGLGTSTAPSTVGQYLVRLGTAISTTELRIEIRDRVLL
jgi:hypothetical protein